MLIERPQAPWRSRLERDDIDDDTKEDLRHLRPLDWYYRDYGEVTCVDVADGRVAPGLWHYSHTDDLIDFERGLTQDLDMLLATGSLITAREAWIVRHHYTDYATIHYLGQLFPDQDFSWLSGAE